MCCGFRGGGRQADAAYQLPAPKPARGNAPRARVPAASGSKRSQAQRHLIERPMAVVRRCGVGWPQGKRTSPVRLVEGDLNETSVRRGRHVRRSPAGDSTGALAWTAPLTGGARPQLAAHVPHAKRSADRAPARYEPLARRILSGTGTISLNVYNYDGSRRSTPRPTGGSPPTPTTAPATRTPTRADHVDLTGVPAATSDNGEDRRVPRQHRPTTACTTSEHELGPTGLDRRAAAGPATASRSITSTSGRLEQLVGARGCASAQNAGGEIHMARTDIAADRRHHDRLRPHHLHGPRDAGRWIHLLLG